MMNTDAKTNPQDPIAHQTDHSRGPSGIYPGTQGWVNTHKSTNVTPHLNTVKNKSQMNMSTDAEGI